jgi:hypothetical protein
LPSFDRQRQCRQDGRVFLYAFDLIALNGDDLRREPLTVRKHMEHDEGETVFVQPVGWVSKASSGSGGTRVSFPGARQIG